MMYVRSLVEDQWSQVPVRIERPAEPDPQAPEPPKLVRTLLKALEKGRWKVNEPHAGVDVFPGLVVSFNDIRDVEFFLLSPHKRASRVCVTAGDIVVFHNPADAEHFIALGQAELISEEEAKQLAEKAATQVKAANVHNIATPAKATKRVAR
jgi:hypothetical protein